MHPHQVIIEALEPRPLPRMPGKVHNVAFPVRSLCHIPDLCLAEDLCTPIPGVAEVVDERRRLAPVVDAGGVHARQRRGFHGDAGAVGTILEARRLLDTVEILL